MVYDMKRILLNCGAFVCLFSNMPVSADYQYKSISERDTWKNQYDAMSNSVNIDGRVGEAGSEGAAIGAAINQIIHEQRSRDVNEAEKQYRERQNCYYCTAK